MGEGLEAIGGIWPSASAGLNAFAENLVLAHGRNQSNAHIERLDKMN